MTTLEAAVAPWRVPIVTEYSRGGADPFRILISTILSLRTKDQTTADASARLFAAADTPEAMLKLTETQIADLIYPVGFYKTKARSILAVCATLMEEHGGGVPADMDELLKLSGVGRKTANLVLTLGFGKPGICVDTHVHRITNRWGYVATKTPEETEMALRKKLPPRYWIPINDWLVAFGQNLCLPVSPWCSRCPLHADCARKGVTRSR
ncbi:MAG: endonuclease III [Candidatus Sumerlaeia bacterium]